MSDPITDGITTMAGVVAGAVVAGAGATVAAAAGAAATVAAAAGAAATAVKENDHDELIKTKVQEMNKKARQWDKSNKFNSLDWRWVKAMLFEESGGPNYLGGKPWQYDPMQVANKGDFGLDTVKGGKEDTDLFSTNALRTKLQSIKHTSFKNGKPDYSSYEERKASEKMTAALSIEVGIIWLFRQAYKGHVRWVSIPKNQVILKHKVKSGDNYTKIAKLRKTTVAELEEKNGKKTLRIGEELKYRESELKRQIDGWNTWSQAIKDYNGGGNANYYKDVNAHYNKIIGGKTVFSQK